MRLETARMQKKKRAERVRIALRKNNIGKLRMAVTKSRQHIYAQLIDDVKGHTLAFVSTNSGAFKASVADRKGWRDSGCARQVALAMVEKVNALGVAKFYFDRGGDRFTGIIKTVAETMREAGLVF